jgi:hypothetical protein
LETEESVSETAVRGSLERLKAQLAALALGAVFYSAVVLWMLEGLAELGALAAYGAVAFGLVAWRVRRLPQAAG